MRQAFFIVLAFSVALAPSEGHAESAESTPPLETVSESTPPNEEEIVAPTEIVSESLEEEEEHTEQVPTSDGEEQESGDTDPSATLYDAPVTPAPPPPIIGLPGSVLDVAYVESVSGLQPGSRLEPGRSVEISDGGCLRMVAGVSAAVSLCGPARAELSSREGQIVLNVMSGRGLLSADASGAAVEVNGLHVEVRGGTVSFTTSGRQRATLVSGEWATIEGGTLNRTAPNPEVSELLSSSFCVPPQPPISITLGDPTELTTETAQARAQGGEGGDEAATAEGGATCVDSADSSAATDPNQGTDGGIDPDARRQDPGRLRLTIRLPR